ncbi:hypothetical protein H2200_004368 [Cladophialophora chaetospira]|uniref:Uncharacterized protein n=1 Tax=Cladophialophora chaetospira TaxID=386627 RepID=A0AA38XD70_9EURO|nr:hypothetical protein H2200_004368 [Cladophialophora chaetospira]
MKTETSAEVSDWADEDTRSRRVSFEQLPREQEASAPLSLLGADRRDPFRTYPVSDHSMRSEELIDFAINVAGASMFDVDPGKSPSHAIVTTIQIAMQDAAPFHAALALFSSVRTNTLALALSRETVYHQVECVQMISHRLVGSASPLDSTVYAVILLWAFESTLAAPESLQRHVNGLHLMVKRRGGISNLKPEVQCMLGWCIITGRGQFGIPFRKEVNTSEATAAAPSLPLSSYHETWHFLSDLHWLTRSSPDLFQAQIPYFSVESPLHRLVFGTIDLASLKAFRDPTREHLVSMPRIFCLLWVLSIFLEHAQSPGHVAAELQDLQRRIRLGHLETCGSPMMLCWLLLRKEEPIAVHPRSWAIVRHINLIKMWDLRQQRGLTTLLVGYLLIDQTAEAQMRQYNAVMEGVMEDMAGLNAESIP